MERQVGQTEGGREGGRRETQAEEDKGLEVVHRPEGQSMEKSIPLQNAGTCCRTCSASNLTTQLRCVLLPQ